MQNQKTVKPILKYTGGKLRELDIIKAHLPKHFYNYYEPFVGGGAVWLNLKAHHYYINDLAQNLMSLYHNVKIKDPIFIGTVQAISKVWNLPKWNKFIRQEPKILIEDTKQISHLEHQVIKLLIHNLKPVYSNPITITRAVNKAFTLKRKYLQRKKKQTGYIRQPQVSAITAIKEAIYDILRYAFNATENERVKTATYWFLREYAYSSMFRFNKSGNFNVPYGGSSYNKKSISTKLERALSPIIQSKLQQTTLSNTDFLKALHQYAPQAQDFVFLDPPYDSSFSSYDNNKFGKNKQIELANYLKHHLQAEFMLVIKATPLIDKLYQPNTHVVGGTKKLKVGSFSKQYQVNFRGRNNQKATHLLITNY